MDLRNFAEKENLNKDKTFGAAGEGRPSGLDERDVRRAINHFGGMSNEQLMRELSKQISAKKRAGKEDEIYSVLEKIKPMLNADQRKRLDEIMGSIT